MLHAHKIGVLVAVVAALYALAVAGFTAAFTALIP